MPTVEVNRLCCENIPTLYQEAQAESLMPQEENVQILLS